MTLFNLRQRDFLRRLELPLWQARQPLPGARQTWVEPPAPPEASPSVTLPSPLVDALPTASMADQAATATEFALYHRRLPRGWLLLCDLEAPAQQLAAGPRRLLDNILFALDVEADAPAAEGVLRWPPPLPGLQLDVDPAAAAHFLEAFIAGQQEREGVTHLLCFGAKPLQLLRLAGVAASVELGTQPGQCSAGGMTLVATHALFELLADPPRKAASWRHLRPLLQPGSSRGDDRPSH